MMNLECAIAYGKRIGVKYYVVNHKGCIYAGTKTLEQAQEKKRKYELEDKQNPWTKGTTKFFIRTANR